MSFKATIRVLIASIAVLLLTGCSATRNSLIDVKATVEPSISERAHKSIAMALLDKGFDLKLNDRDLGVITTDYKKYSSVSGWPPFDFYLQMKSVVRNTSDGKLQITLTPKIKEQNRINASAFTEHSLIIYSDKEQSEDYATHSGRGKAMLDGQILFLSIVHSIAEALGVPAEQFRQNVQQSEVFGM